MNSGISILQIFKLLILEMNFLLCFFCLEIDKINESILLENGTSSPDRSGNPFVAGFATKDWNG